MSSIPHHHTTPEKLQALVQILKSYPSGSAAAQRQRIMAALALFPCTSSEMQRHLDCYDCNARINELRHKEGRKIGMAWVQQETEAGELHRVVLTQPFLHRSSC